MICRLFLAIPLSELYLDKFEELAEKFNINESSGLKKKINEKQPGISQLSC